MKGRINRPTPGVKRVVLPRVGFVKVGLKEVGKNGKEYPKSVDYFIPTGKYAGLFTQAYGEKPQTIQIVFPDDDPEKVCNEMYEYRDDDGRRIAYGDGETFFVWNGKQYCHYSAKDYPNLMAGVAEKHPNRSVLKGGDKEKAEILANSMISDISPDGQRLFNVYTFGQAIYRLREVCNNYDLESIIQSYNDANEVTQKLFSYQGRKWISKNVIDDYISMVNYLNNRENERK